MNKGRFLDEHFSFTDQFLHQGWRAIRNAFFTNLKSRPEVFEDESGWVLSTLSHKMFFDNQVL